MSVRSRQKQSVRNQPDSQKSRVVVGLISVVLVGVAVFALQRGFRPRTAVDVAQSGTAGVFRTPARLSELWAVSSEDLARLDVALVNLLCAEGLRGSEGIDIPACLRTLDDWAKHVESETKRHWYRYSEHKEDFENSDARFRMEMLCTVLQQDLKIRYNMERAPRPLEPLEPNNQFFANSADVFLHGLLGERRHGTCSSMPVLIVAVGRRLGYPLKLVTTRTHLFVRWEDDRERFNIEATSKGFVSHADEKYRTWPEPITMEEEQAEGYLKSLTPAQEFAAFLSIRAFCCEAMEQPGWALGAFSQAAKRHPECRMYQTLFARAERAAYESSGLDRGASMLYRLRQLDVPDGPMRTYYLQHKARLQAMLLLKNPQMEQEVAQELPLLEAEIATSSLRR